MASGAAASPAAVSDHDVVVLVPGFLGFSRFGDFYYFADRVGAALRGAIELRVGRSVPVVPATSLPAHRLVDRQAALLDILAELDQKLEQVSRFHLVGHSAGGVDAQLLTCDEPLGRAEWSPAERALCGKIATVCTIATPHRGTGLSNSSLTRFMQDPLRHLDVLPSIGKLGWDLARILPRMTQASDALRGASMARPEALKFACQLIQHRGLIEDLATEHMEELRSRMVPTGRSILKSFVTVVPRAALDQSDPFFTDLHELTATPPKNGPSSAVTATVAKLNLHASKAICGLPNVALDFDASVSDGIVNSARQLVNSDDPDELGGIVVADHADVLGHYDRKDALISGRSLNAGVFHSGAGFGDRQFFELYRRVALTISKAIA